jgi:hypothetical protein
MSNDHQVPHRVFSHRRAALESLSTGNYFQIDEHDLAHVSVTFEKVWSLQELQAYCNNCGDEVYVSSVARAGLNS